MKLSRLGFICLAASASLLPAQQPSIVEQIVDNYSKLAATVELDRPVYFPSEEIAATVIVRNPTADPLRVATPFHYLSGFFSLREQLEDGSWRNMNLSESSQFLLDAATPNIILNPGEERRFTAKSTDPEIDGSTLPRLPNDAPTQPGTYQVAYMMGGGRKNFRVVEPFFETAAQTTLRTELVEVEDGETLRRTQYFHVVSVRWDQLSYICVGYPTPAPGSVLPRRGQRLSYGQIPVVPFRRVLTTATPIQELRVTEDPLGNFVITWRDTNNLEGIIRLSPTLQPL